MSRTRRDRDNIRELLIEAAVLEFGAQGFSGASTSAIARRADAHQPQINYHFATKEALWRAAVEHLFEEFDDAIIDIDFNKDPACGFATLIERMVHLAVERPQLNQILTHEATVMSERLAWITHRHVKPRFTRLRALWVQLQDIGVAAPIHPDFLYYVLIGSASLPYMNVAEARQLFETDPTDGAMIERHVASLVATLLPGTTHAN